MTRAAPAPPSRASATKLTGSWPHLAATPAAATSNAEVRAQYAESSPTHHSGLLQCAGQEPVEGGYGTFCCKSATFPARPQQARDVRARRPRPRRPRLPRALRLRALRLASRPVASASPRPGAATTGRRRPLAGASIATASSPDAAARARKRRRSQSFPNVAPLSKRARPPRPTASSPCCPAPPSSRGAACACARSP